MSKKLALLLRQLTPGLVNTLRAWVRYRCLISPRAEVEITDNLQIGPGTQISAFAKIKTFDGVLSIGKNSVIGSCVAIASGQAGIVIGDDCFLSPNVVITPGTHRYRRMDVPIIRQGMDSKGIHIGDDVWVGANCTILDGAAIGKGSIVSPNSVVGGSIPAFSIATGNPAKVIFERR